MYIHVQCYKNLEKYMCIRKGLPKHMKSCRHFQRYYWKISKAGHKGAKMATSPWLSSRGSSKWLIRLVCRERLKATEMLNSNTPRELKTHLF